MTNREQKTNYERTIVPGIYIGDRRDSFKRLIESLLNKGKIKQKYKDILLSPHSLSEYANAFTSDLVDETNNYQVYEQLGDLVGNQFIVWYIYRRFPQLRCSDGVKVAARLRINYGSKQSFYKFADDMGFWPFISATNDLRYRKKKDLLEDVFEAFLGVTASIMDDSIRIGVGNAVAYQFLSVIFDEIDISLKYEDLYDSKTILKELFDIHDKSLGPLVYETVRHDMIATSYVYRVKGGEYFVKSNGKIDKKRIQGGLKILIGKGSAALESAAQQVASKQAIDTLRKQGYRKTPPKCYQMFDGSYTGQTNTITYDFLRKKWGSDPNTLCKTKDKSKYQCRYMSTPLALYCRTRNIEGVNACLKWGSTSEALDSDYMSCIDLLFIGKKDVSTVRTILSKLIDARQRLRINKVVLDNYYSDYMDNDWFKQIVCKFQISG